jgi:hypothetical protein
MSVMVAPIVPRPALTGAGGRPFAGRRPRSVMLRIRWAR